MRACSRAQDCRDDTHQPVGEQAADRGLKNKMKLGYDASLIEHPLTHPEIKNAFLDVIAQTQAAVDWVPVNLFHPLALLGTYYCIATTEAYTNLSRYDGFRYAVPAKRASPANR